MSDKNSGFHGEFSSSDARSVTLTETTARFTLYNQYGNAITLQSDEQVVITQIQVQALGDTTITLYDGANATIAAGETIYKGVNTVANFCLGWSLVTPHYCTVGTYPKVVASAAGQVDCGIRGYIVKAIR